jgi:hypothetical protein
MTRAVPFRPTRSRVYQVALVRPAATPALQRLCDEMVEDFRGTSDSGRYYYQLPWMGRACFRSIGHLGCVLGKGVGPGQGSEDMRALLDRLWRSLSDGDGGGCIRLDGPEFYPFLAQYYRYDNTRQYRVFDPRPEGLSIFGAIVREYVTSIEVYESVQIASPIAVSVLRHHLPCPWGDGHSVDAAKDFVAESFTGVVSRVDADTADYAVCVDKMTYPDLDAGVLIRTARTPVRLQNIYDLAVAGEWAEVSDMMRNVFAELEVPEDAWVGVLCDTLGATAGQLLEHNIIHGQIDSHYQNLTAAGELCDFDSTVVAPWGCGQSSIDLCGKLSDMDGEFGLEMSSFYREDIELFAPTPEVAACNLVEQAYALWSASLRAADILARLTLGGTSAHGTVLDGHAIAAHLSRFIDAMNVRVGQCGRQTLRAAEGLSGLIAERCESIVGDRSVLGWANERRPFNHFSHTCDLDDARFLAVSRQAFLRAVHAKIR